MEKTEDGNVSDFTLSIDNFLNSNKGKLINKEICLHFPQKKTPTNGGNKQLQRNERSTESKLIENNPQLNLQKVN